VSLRDGACRPERRLSRAASSSCEVDIGCSWPGSRVSCLTGQPNPTNRLQMQGQEHIAPLTRIMTTAIASPYTYEQLNGAREIRLITLYQGAGPDAISLTIDHAYLDEKPEYEALLYVWGPQAPSYPVRCHHGSIAVGENLRDALQHLRKPDAPRVLWIDRIAINQEDLNERGTTG
jgi:Heterokaryon incompatibility protein (HET)